ncbi:hypothetical protein [Mycobacterium sp. OTB74]|nr:hypothetical protein [Mycobacterium sp. OTB74]
MRLVVLFISAAAAIAAVLVWRSHHGAEVWHTAQSDTIEGP